MTDEELVETLRRTFHNQADALRPGPGRPPLPRPQSRRVPRPGRRKHYCDGRDGLAGAVSRLLRNRAAA